MRRFIVFSVLLLLSHATSVAFAATYYVGQNVAGASDDNDGLASESGSANRGPWKTLSKAAAVAGAGDRVWVFDGDYRDEDTGWGAGHIPIVNSGEATDRMIVFHAAPGHKPIVESILIRNKGWIAIVGFHFQSRRFSRPGNWRNMPDIVVEVRNLHASPRRF